MNWGEWLYLIASLSILAPLFASIFLNQKDKGDILLELDLNKRNIILLAVIMLSCIVISFGTILEKLAIDLELIFNLAICLNGFYLSYKKPTFTTKGFGHQDMFGKINHGIYEWQQIKEYHWEENKLKMKIYTDKYLNFETKIKVASEDKEKVEKLLKEHL